MFTNNVSYIHTYSINYNYPSSTYALHTLPPPHYTPPLDKDGDEFIIRRLDQQSWLCTSTGIEYHLSSGNTGFSYGTLRDNKRIVSLLFDEIDDQDEKGTPEVVVGVTGVSLSWEINCSMIILGNL